MSWDTEFPFEVKFETTFYEDCSIDLLYWLKTNAGTEWVIPRCLLGEAYYGSVRFKSSEHAMLFKLSNPFRERK